MKFPLNSVYTSNGYRIPIGDLTAYSAPITHRNHPPIEGSETFFRGTFHKDRFFGHFATFTTFTPNPGGGGEVAEIILGRLGENQSHLGSFPSFWISAGRSNGGSNKPFGYAHHFAEIGPNTDSASPLRGVFFRNGRQASNTSGQSETIFDLRGKSPNGSYIKSAYTGRSTVTSAHRTPFHAKYNITSQSHDYPRALYDNEADFQIIGANGAVVNPLSKANTYGGRPGASFSVFRHYGSSSSRSGSGAITLTIPATPAVNPEAVAQGGWGHDYLVKKAKHSGFQTIAGTPISRRNWYTKLDTIEVYSPYGDAVKLDFLNGTRYNELLHTSSIWSK
jgi:hypothetical protein